MTPDGKSAYVISGGISAEVAQYDIDPVTGGLSPKTPASVSVAQPPQVGGTRATDLAVSPDGKSAYVVHFGFRADSKISQLNIDPESGVLSPKTPATFVWGSLSARIAFSPDGTSAYVSISSTFGDPGGVSQLNVDPQSGTLSPKTPSTVSAGPGAHHIAVGPLPRFPGDKEDCERGRWRGFPQFKNQGQCVVFVVHRKDRTDPWTGLVVWA